MESDVPLPTVEELAALHEQVAHQLELETAARREAQAECRRLQRVVQAFAQEARVLERERARLLAAYARFWPSHLEPIVPRLAPGSVDAWVVCIHAGGGLLRWAVPASEIAAFAHLPVEASHEATVLACSDEERLDRLAATEGRELICGGCRSFITGGRGIVTYSLELREFYCSIGCQVKRLGM